MAFVPEYENDVFVSYAHLDNEAFASQPKGWVTRFVDDLRTVLSQRLASRDVKIWMDGALTGNAPFAGDIEQALRKSATLLVFASPSYLRSEWCARERGGFLRTVREGGVVGSRLFRVEIEEIDRAQVPEEFRDRLGYQFWGPDRNGNPLRFGFPVPEPVGDHAQYYTMLNKLRIELAAELERLRAGAKPAAAAADAPAVFLAELTDDLELERAGVESFLGQHGIAIVPDGAYPADHPGYLEQLRSDLRRCKAFVQLLSKAPGKLRAGWPARFPRLQHDEAIAAGLPILQWRARDLDIESVKPACPEHYELVAGQNVRSCGIEEFKQAVADAARRPPAAAPQPHGAEVEVFVTADRSDRGLAENVCEMLSESGATSWILPSKGDPRQIQEVFEERLRDCDAFMLVYGNTDAAWVQHQLMQARKALTGRTKPLSALALVDGPPSDKDAVGVYDHRVRRFDWRAGHDPAALQDFVRSLRGSNVPA
jgi:hypothetical protein